MAWVSPEPLKLLSRLNETTYVLDPASLDPQQTQAQNGSAHQPAAAATTTAAVAAAAATPTPMTDHKAPPPDIVVILAWGSAPPRAVAKYVAKHRLLFPSARLLLITTSFRELFTHTLISQQKALAPAIAYIRGSVSGGGDGARSRPPRVLVHTFSNGGAFKLIALAKEWRRASKKDGDGREMGERLPITALAIDSAPGRPAPLREMRAISAVLPQRPVVRQAALVLVFAYLALVHALEFVLRRPPLFTQIFYALLDPALFDTRRVPRLYLYSREDQMIDSRDVEEHARLAAGEGGGDGQGKAKVSMERFEGSKHVAHMVLDPIKYWNAVTSFWDGCV